MRNWAILGHNDVILGHNEVILRNFGVVVKFFCLKYFQILFLSHFGSKVLPWNMLRCEMCQNEHFSPLFPNFQNLGNSPFLTTWTPFWRSCETRIFLLSHYILLPSKFFVTSICPFSDIQLPKKCCSFPLPLTCHTPCEILDACTINSHFFNLIVTFFSIDWLILWNIYTIVLHIFCLTLVALYLYQIFSRKWIL